MKVIIVIIGFLTMAYGHPLVGELPSYCELKNGDSLICSLKGDNNEFDFNVFKTIFQRDTSERQQMKLFALEWANLEYLPADAFDLGVEFETIRIASSRLKHINRNAFGVNRVTKRIELYNNQIEDGDGESSVFDAFRGLYDLESINLSGNRLTSIPSGAFAGSDGEKKSKLVEATFVTNDIKTVEDGAFEHAPNLERIYLDYNQLEMIKTNTFKFPGRGRHLEIRMSYNQIETIEAGAFNGIDRDLTLDFEENRLTKLPGQVFNVRNIVFMDLWGNPFECDCHLSWLKGRRNDDLYQFAMCQSGGTVVDYANKNC